MADPNPAGGNPAAGDPNPANNPGTGNRDPNNPGTGDANDPTKLFVSKDDFGKTAAHIRGLGDQLKTLASTAITADKLVELLGLEKDEESGKFRMPQSKTPAAGAQQRPEDDPVMKRVKALEKQLADEQQKVADERARTESNTRDTALIAALQKAGAINPTRDYVHLVGKVTKSEKGYVARVADEYGAEKDVDVDGFAEQYLKQNPELKKTTQQGGSGTPPGAGSKPGMRPGSTIIPKSQWSDINFMVKNRKLFDSGDYVRGD